MRVRWPGAIANTLRSHAEPRGAANAPLTPRRTQRRRHAESKLCHEIALDRGQRRRRRRAGCPRRVRPGRVGGRPPNTQPPSIIGSPITGTVLTGDRGTWTGTGITYRYAWQRCDPSGANCTPIAGATGTKYTLTTAVLGATIRFAVTASDSSGEATATSSPTAGITTANGMPANSSPPTITGAATVGTTLAWTKQYVALLSSSSTSSAYC